jgi:hypothetical protein
MPQMHGAKPETRIGKSSYIKIKNNPLKKVRIANKRYKQRVATRKTFYMYKKGQFSYKEKNYPV